MTKWGVELNVSEGRGVTQSKEVLDPISMKVLSNDGWGHNSHDRMCFQYFMHVFLFNSSTFSGGIGR